MTEVKRLTRHEVVREMAHEILWYERGLSEFRMVGPEAVADVQARLDEACERLLALGRPGIAPSVAAWCLAHGVELVDKVAKAGAAPAHTRIGRPPAVAPDVAQAAWEAIAAGRTTVRAAARAAGVSENALRRAMARAEETAGTP